MATVNEGMLLKKNMLQRYENLFFRLTTRGISYWSQVDEKGEPKGHPKEIIEKTEITSVESMSGDARFTLETEHTSWLLQAATEEEKNEWIKAIHGVVRTTPTHAYKPKATVSAIAGFNSREHYRNADNDEIVSFEYRGRERVGSLSNDVVRMLPSIIAEVAAESRFQSPIPIADFPRTPADKMNRLIALLIHHTAQHGNVKALRDLRRCGADLSAKGPYEDFAVCTKCKVNVSTFFDKCTRCNTALVGVHYQMTAAHKAAMFGQIEILQKLFEFSIDISTKGDMGITPGHFAAARGHVSTLQALSALVRKDAKDGKDGKGSVDLNAKDANECTPVHIACIKGDYAMLAKLKKLDCNMDAKDRW